MPGLHKKKLVPIHFYQSKMFEEFSSPKTYTQCSQSSLFAMNNETIVENHNNKKFKINSKEGSSGTKKHRFN